MPLSCFQGQAVVAEAEAEADELAHRREALAACIEVPGTDGYAGPARVERPLSSLLDRLLNRDRAEGIVRTISDITRNNNRKSRLLAVSVYLQLNSNKS